MFFTSEVGVRQSAMGFFVRVSVFNQFVVSVFWNFMADIFNTVQARRLHGFVAVGGSLRSLGAGIAGISLFALPLAAIRAATGLWLARRHARIAIANEEGT